MVLEPRSNSGNVADAVGPGGCRPHTVRTADAPRRPSVQNRVVLDGTGGRMEIIRREKAAVLASPSISWIAQGGGFEAIMERIAVDPLRATKIPEEPYTSIT